MARTKKPWMQFYPRDWQASMDLRSVSLAARGLWIEMLCIMHQSPRVGSLLIGDQPVTPERLAALVCAPVEEVRAALAELGAAGVYTQTRDGRIVSRRLEKDAEKSRKNRENGSKGGNPTLCNKRENEGLDNPHIPYTRGHIPETINHNVALGSVAEEIRDGWTVWAAEVYGDRATRRPHAQDGGVAARMVAAGASAGLVRGAVVSACDRLHQQGRACPSTLKYFEKIVSDALTGGDNHGSTAPASRRRSGQTGSEADRAILAALCPDAVGLENDGSDAGGAPVVRH